VYSLDVCNRKGIKSMFCEIYEETGQIDILVNNAGIGSLSSIEEITVEEWDEVLNINLKAPFFCSQMVIPYMKQRNYGKIINIASVSGQTGGVLAGADYSASKAGVICITKSLAKYLAPYNINVNAVSPGIIDTRMAAFHHENTISAIPLKRKGLPEDIANAALFLASDLSDYITGCTIPVNGGSYMG
jgi:3-oxoacyl-[acyl-carrier protein] reductase